MARLDHIVTVNLNTAIDRVIEVPGWSVGSHAKGRQISRYPAGKAINVSRALARLRRDSVATGFVGQAESSQFEQFLRATGPGRIICQLLTVRGQTRENITLIDPIHHTDTHIRDEGFEITDADFHRMMSKLGLLARPGAIMVFSGSLPRGMDITQFNMLVMMATAGGARVVLDLGGQALAQMLAPAITDETQGPSHTSPDVDASTAPPGNLLWLVKPNREELAQMFGLASLQDDEQVMQAGLRLARHVRCVVVTLGSEGAWLMKDGQAWRGRVEIDPATVINTVGCGDAMLAGLLDGRLMSQQEGGEGATSTETLPLPVRMLRRGLAAGTANALWPGIAQFDQQQVDQLDKQVQVERRA